MSRKCLEEKMRVWCGRRKDMNTSLRYFVSLALVVDKKVLQSPCRSAVQTCNRRSEAKNRGICCSLFWVYYPTLFPWFSPGNPSKPLSATLERLPALGTILPRLLVTTFFFLKTWRHFLCIWFYFFIKGCTLKFCRCYLMSLDVVYLFTLHDPTGYVGTSGWAQRITP